MKPTHRRVPDNPPVLIIGCGIAGTTTAIALKRAGIQSIIYEAYPEPGDEVGSFLGLTPNGQDVLKTFGIAKPILADGFLTHGFHFSNASGKSLGTVPSDTVTIKRGSITKGLRAEVMRQGTHIEYGKKLKDIAVIHKDRVTAHFEDGTEVQGSAIIGADGIHSRTRQITFPDSPQPKYTGLISSGAIANNKINLPTSKGKMEMIFGKKAFFCYLVRPDGLIYWFANIGQNHEPKRGELDAISNDQWKNMLLGMHVDDQPVIRQIIKSTQTPIARYPIYDIQSIPKWHKGRVCLIGDAVHAPAPSAGQGASLALEDGIVIAKCLRDIADIEQAFATFVSLRKERAEKLVKQSRRAGSGKSPSNAVSRFIRDLVLPLFLKKAGDATKWMYTYHVDWDEKITPKYDF